MTMSSISADYYLTNDNARMSALARRIAALERAMGIVPGRVGAQEGTSAAMPDALLPSAADIGELLLVDRIGGGIYRLECEVDDRMRLVFVYIGQVRDTGE